MIVYSETKAQFQDDILSNRIDEKILEKFNQASGRIAVSESERTSWNNSLGFMERVLNDNDISDDVKVAIEYHIPRTSKRVDFIISGMDEDNKESVVIVELKQWTKAEITDKDGIVTTRFKHGEKEVTHPCYQAWSYKSLLDDYNQTVREDDINLSPCAYLHNYENDGIINNQFYQEYIDKAPLFLKDDAKKLRDFIKNHVKYGGKSDILYRIDNGKIKPSKNLADHLSSILTNNEEFVMIDDQKVVFETAVKLAKESTENGKKNVLIVNGGPGTGKSVVAINLLSKLTNDEFIASYVTRNSAPRVVFEAKLTGSLKKSRISNLFISSGSLHNCSNNEFDVLIIDEAHRLTEKSGMFNNLGENQIMEIIKSSKFSVFFLDEDQKVTIKDIGDSEEIRMFARRFDSNITELNLESQFRCNGSDGYIAWLDSILQIRETANDNLDEIDYDFKIFDNPQKLYNEIIEKNELNNKSRVVAGYCWDWISKKVDIPDIVIGDLEAKWNLEKHGQSWIIQPDSVTEIGCIHTCQGLELDYVGVIIGPDFVIRNGVVETHPENRAKTDQSLKGWKNLMKLNPDKAKQLTDTIIKNTYRTLMTRGMKGCYVYFTDKETEEYFRSKSEKNRLI